MEVNKDYFSSLFKSGFSSFGLKVINLVLVLATSIVLARILGPEEYGTYSFVYAVIMLLIVPAQFGLPDLLVREVAKYKANSKWELINGILRISTKTVFIVTLGLSFVGVSYVFFMYEPFGDTFNTFLFGFFLLPVFAFMNTFSASLRGMDKIILGILPKQVLQPGLLVILAIIFSGYLTPAYAMGLNVVGTLIALIASLFFLKRYLPQNFFSFKPKYKKSAWLKAILPLSLIAGINVINNQSDIIILGFLRSSSEVGLYRIAVQGANLVSFTLLAGGFVLGPNISKLHYLKEKKALQKLARKSARIIFLGSVPIVIIYYFLGEQILSLFFGEEYAGSYQALMILSIGHLFNTFVGAVTLLLNMTGYEKETALAVGVTACANIALNLIFIPYMGMEGAALATSGTIFILNSILVFKVYKKLGVTSLPIYIRW